MPLFQGRDKSKMYPANPGPLPQGGGTARNSTAVYGGGTAADVVPHGKGNFCAQIQNKDVAVTMSTPPILPRLHAGVLLTSTSR
jgi:hypothetical protein